MQADEEAAMIPTFAACQTDDAMEFYVRVRWPDGGEAVINHFATLQAAHPQFG
jgi:hypothetical protein